MEGFCRGCLIKYEEPMELLQYTEKNRRLFVYSTGIQVKRNDTFSFQLCKDCFLNMKQACKFKKNCRNSDKRFRNYLALKDIGDPVDFCTFLKNSDDSLTFRFPMTSGNSTPATQKCRDDDNESTCTSIRNFMTDILQGEEMPDTEARIIKEVIEEEADLLDDSLDSHWLQDDMSIDTDFRLDFSFSQFSTPRTVNNDRCYTPKQKEDQFTFDTINTEKQTKILNDFTNALKNNENIEELCIFAGDASEKTESFKNLKELSPFGIDAIDGMEKSEIDALKTKDNLKDFDLKIDEIDGMETCDSQIVECSQNLELCDFGLQEINSSNKTENSALKTNKKLKELTNFGIVNNIEYVENNTEINRKVKSKRKAVKSTQNQKELISHFALGSIEAFGKSDSNNLKSNENVKGLCDFSLDDINAEGRAGSKAHKNVKSLKELCDFSLDSIGSFERPASNNNKTNDSLKELYELSLNSFDDTARSGSNNTFKTHHSVKELDLNVNDFNDIANSRSKALKHKSVSNICDFGIDGTDKSESNLDLQSLPERDKIDTPDFDIPKGVIGSIQSNNDVSNSSINIEALLKDKPCTIDTNLEDALKNTDSQEFSLEDILASPRVFPAESAASTPTITNILFGEKLDTPDSNTKIKQYIVYPAESAVSTPNTLFGEKCDTTNTSSKMEKLIVLPAESGASTPSITNLLFDSTDINTEMESYHNVQGDIEIFEEFFQNDTKEFDLEDIIRENGGLKSEDWKKPIAVNGEEVNNKENELRNIENDISIEDTESKKDDLIYISHNTPNDKFDIEYLYCKLCKIRYDTSRALSAHFTIFHKIKIVKPKTRNSNNKKSKDQVDISELPPDDRFDIKNSYCKLCKIKYDSGRALSVHFSKTHNTKIEKPKHRKSRAKNNIPETAHVISDTSHNDKFDMEKSYCKLCKKKYKSSRALSIHLSVTHNIKISKSRYDRKNRGEKLCNNCGTKCGDPSNFARHVKTCQFRGSIFKCDICFQIFEKKSHLEKHKISHTNMKIEKAARKEFVCTSCGLVLRGQSNYALHMRRHTKDYSTKCSYCDKGFYRESDLRAHLRKHTGDTPFSCTFCPKLFTRRDVLLRHIHTHLGLKLFECDYCGLKCMRKSDLINHIGKKSCRKLKETKKRNKKCKKEIMEIDTPEKLEEKVVIGKQVKEAKKVEKAEKKYKSDEEENMDIDVTEEQEEKVEIEKQVKIQNEKVVVMYAKGSDATIRKQLPFLETSNIPEEQEKVGVQPQKEEAAVLTTKGSDTTISQQLPFLETDISN